MKVYIAGPMTGYEQHNFPAFDVAKRDLEWSGNEVVSPADLSRKLWKDRGESYKEFQVNYSPSREELAEFMSHDLTELSTCGGVWLLPGWEKSKGVAIELAYAEFLGIPVIHRPASAEESPLAVAGRIVSGARQTHYGHPLDNHGNTAEMWRSWLSRRHGVDVPLEPEDVCWLMILLKASREANCSKPDNAVDVCGYAENVHLIRSEREQRIAAGASK